MRLRAADLTLACLTIATASAAQRPAEPRPERPAIRVVKLSGTARERGLAHGTALRTEIRTLVEAWKADLRRTYTDPERFITRFYADTDFEAAIDQWTPGLLDEVRGIAVGAGIDYETMFVYQLIDEIWAQGKRIAKADKCTAIGVDRRDGHPTIVAQNLDIPRWYHGFQVLLHITDQQEKLQTFVVTAPGLVAMNGMNSAGIAVAVNTLLQLQPCADGLPVAFVVRGVLTRKDWPAARRFVYDVRHASGQSYTVGGRDVAHAYECSADRVTRFQPFEGAGFTYHTNHPLANEQWADSFRERAKARGKPPEETLPDCTRFAWLRERFTKDTVPTLDRVLEALRSKESKVPICNPGTFACTVMLLGAEPELRVSAGGADRNELQVFRFAGR